jgi:hypothetical protein
MTTYYIAPTGPTDCYNISTVAVMIPFNQNIFHSFGVRMAPVREIELTNNAPTEGQIWPRPRQ